MSIHFAESFKKDFRHLPFSVQKLFDEKLKLFDQNSRHPSLRVKKIQGYENRWEGSINLSYRFTFEIHDDHYLLRRIGPHDILKTP